MESPSFSQDEKDEIIISSVRVRPELFDSRDRNFKNTKLKDNAWSSVGDLVGVNGEEARRRWLLIKNNFTKYCRRKKAENRSGAGAGAVHDKMPPLYQMMTWYLKYSAVKRRTTSNFPGDQEMLDTQSSQTSIWDTPLWENENNITADECEITVSDENHTAVNTSDSVVSVAVSNSSTGQVAVIYESARSPTCPNESASSAAGCSGSTGSARTATGSSGSTGSVAGPSTSATSATGSSGSTGSVAVPSTSATSATVSSVRAGRMSGFNSSTGSPVGISNSTTSPRGICGSSTSPTGNGDSAMSAGSSASVGHNQTWQRINPPPQNFTKKKKDDLVPIFTQGMRAFTQYIERGSQADPHIHHFVGYASELLKKVPDDLRLECEERVLAVIKSYIP